jgi:hypothetical protein
MIEISLSSAIVLYSAILGAMVFAIWLYTEVTVRRSYRVLEKQHLWRCVFCGYIYLDEDAETVSQCPQCESYNAVTDKRARYVPPRHAHQEENKAADKPEEPRRNPSHRKRPQQHRRGPRKR